MSQLRYLLYSTTGKDAAKTANDKLANLEALFLKAKKRKLSVEVYVSSWGDPKSPSVGLTAYHTPEQRDDVQFLIDNLS